MSDDCFVKKTVKDVRWLYIKIARDTGRKEKGLRILGKREERKKEREKREKKRNGKTFDDETMYESV